MIAVQTVERQGLTTITCGEKSLSRNKDNFTGLHTIYIRTCFAQFHKKSRCDVYNSMKEVVPHLQQQVK